MMSKERGCLPAAHLTLEQAQVGLAQIDHDQRVEPVQAEQTFRKTLNDS